MLNDNGIVRPPRTWLFSSTCFIAHVNMERLLKMAGRKEYFLCVQYITQIFRLLKNLAPGGTGAYFNGDLLAGKPGCGLRHIQIGRASCRERVEISVVAVSL